MKISHKDITILIQGPFHTDLTPKAFESVKKLLPDSEIVFSTWEGAELPKLEFAPETVLYNKCPDGDHFGNFNRQLFSTSEGLKLVKTKYVLKMRSDFALDNLNMIGFYNPDAPRDVKIFQERLVAYVWCPKNKKKNPRLFHPGDFFYFGLTDDVKNLFSIDPIQPDENVKIYPSSELYLWDKFLRSKNLLNYPFEDLFDCSKKDYFNKILADNYVFVSYSEMGIRALKAALKKNNIPTSNTAFKFKHWLKISNCKQPRSNFPFPTVSKFEVLKAYVIKLIARTLQIVYWDKKKRDNARARLYDYL